MPVFVYLSKRVHTLANVELSMVQMQSREITLTLSNIFFFLERYISVRLEDAIKDFLSSSLDNALFSYGQQLQKE